VPAMAGVQAAYYLVHSMGSSGKFEQEDRQAAQNFADVARDFVRRYNQMSFLSAWAGSEW